MDAKITQLVIQPATKGRNAVRTFTTKPAQDVSYVSGKLFGLIEINSTNSDNESLIDFLIDEIKTNYYDVSAGSRKSLSERFEAALKKTNIAFTTYLEREHINVDLEKINILIGISHGRDLHFTILGSIWSVLFYHISKDSYRIINIVDSTQSRIVTPDPLKLFSQIVSGRIRQHDMLLVTTENVFDYFSLDRVKSIITAGAATHGLAELRVLLTKTMQKESFGVITVQSEDIPAPAEPEAIEQFDYQQAATRDSINQLIATERQTERLLTPSLKPELRKYVSSLSAALQNYASSIRSSASTLYRRQVPHKQTKFSLPRPQIPRQLSDAAPRVTKMVKNATAPLRGLGIQLSNKLQEQPLFTKTYIRIKEISGRGLHRYRALPKSSQRLFLVSVLLVFLLVNSTVWLGVNQRRTAKLEAFNSAIVDATTKRDEAESSLIYRDENMARQLLIDAKNILEQAKPASEDQQNQVALLQRDITVQLNNLQHIIDIVEPIQIANFKNVDPEAQTAPFLVFSRGFLFTQNSGSKSIYRTNVNSRTISSITSALASSYSIGIPSADGELLLYGGNVKPVRLTVGQDELREITLALPEGTIIDDIAAFSGRLYILDRFNNEIYRLNRSNAGYDGATRWLRADNITLTDAVSLVVDGSVYLINQRGELLKLENGKSTDFKVGAVDPALESPTKLRSPEGSPYLYVIDPPSKRVIVFNKQGGLVQQYTSGQFTNLKDIAVDERDKKIYVLSDSVVYAIPAKHLE